MAPMKIDSDAIRNLAELLNETGLTEIEIAEGDMSLRVTKAGVVQAVAPTAIAAPANSSAPIASIDASVGLEGHAGAVTSPMVGTAYLKPEPSSPSFVKVGDKVNVGDTLLIIEAMKVMNPIKAEKSGTVSQVIVDDTTPVEFGEVLMIIE